jgi:glucose/arabinose dehydrogenase
VRAAALLLACLLAASAGAAPPAGFVETDIGGDWRDWPAPRPGGTEVAGLAFSSDGTRLYVVGRGGAVWLIENGVRQAAPFLDISDEVGGWRDFGLLGFALHPNFEQNGYVYALYVVDRYYLFNYGTPGYNRASLESQRFQATIGRISRFTADPATGLRTVLPGSQLILVGATPQDGIPILHESHGTGQLVFGQDGTLLATNGDGASYSSVDIGSASETYWNQALGSGIIETWENVGAWRSQLVDSINGNVLRIDPATGHGISSNRWFDPANPASVRSRTFAVGLRNPYRFSHRPGTGSHHASLGNPGTFYIGDVGWGSSEDLHVLKQGGQNFGWPAFEGINHIATTTLGATSTSNTYWNGPSPFNGTTSKQNPLAKNPLAGQPGCNYPFLRFRDLIDQETQNPSDPPSWPNPCNTGVQIPDQWTDPGDGKVYRYDKFVHSRPPIAWRGSAWVSSFNAQGNPTHSTLSPPLGVSFSGNASTGGVWYTGTDFPPEWRNTYFHGDYGAGWIKSFGFDANDRLIDVVDFLPSGNAVTFIATNPVSGGIYYVKWGERVRHIRWVGSGNLSPTAQITPPVAWSTQAQLQLALTGSASTDPDPGDSLSYSWDFGDGETSTQADPIHTFSAAGSAPQTFLVRLTVTDEALNVDDAEILVSLNNSPPGVEIETPPDGSFYSMAGPSTVAVTSSVSDAEHAPAQLTCSLLVELVHNNHAHAEPPIGACEADVEITPAGCDGNDYSWRFTLTVSDPEGLSTKAVSEIFPDCTPPVCGDGVVEAPEECDDGDPNPGDCCTASCTFEPAGGICPGDGNACSQDVCDGAGTCAHPPEPDGLPCSDGDACTQPDQCSAGICGGSPLPDSDLDGQCDAIDPDDDGDGVGDGDDSAPLNRFVCRDADADTCDDCSSGTDTPAADGPDTDSDGACNAGDPDDDGDGVADGDDSAPLDRFVCRDADADTCDDCSGGTNAPASDGLDTDADGACDEGDPDDDGDGVADGSDAAPVDRFVCRDADADTCDDCVSGTDAPTSDGLDTDADGACDAGDADDDGDGVADGSDSAPLDRFVCRDADADTCDDCSSGTDAPVSDGADFEADGQCDAGDPDDDGDGAGDEVDSEPFDRFRCGDGDGDSCEDCSTGSEAAGSDGPDLDADGLCDAGDPDDDGDGFLDPADNCPYYFTANASDVDGDGRGDACECTDQNGDGRNDVMDLLAINRAVFSPALASPLCDGNGDGLCDVNDIGAANVEIYSPTNTSTCSRQPVPGP